jgi:hypothetical protein
MPDLASYDSFLFADVKRISSEFVLSTPDALLWAVEVIRCGIHESPVIGLFQEWMRRI